MGEIKLLYHGDGRALAQALRRLAGLIEKNDIHQKYNIIALRDDDGRLVGTATCSNDHTPYQRTLDTERE